MIEPNLAVSIIIPNYNYGTYIACAIDSALRIDWPNIEVIVVDDGSTDNSRSVIESYGDRITAIFQENASQSVACTTGFFRSKGDLILFLDSDDFVDPSIIRETMAVWRTGVAKVQFQMRTVDARGMPLGSYLPQYRIVPTPEQIRRWAIRASSYPTPPGSANIYARATVEAVFPLDPAIHDRSSDSMLLAAAPLLGDVIVIPKPLVSYRIHGRNDGAMSSLDVTRFSVEVKRAMLRHSYARTLGAAIGTEISAYGLYRSQPFNAYRLASLCLSPNTHPIPADSRSAILRQMLKAAFSTQGIGIPERSVFVVWALLVVVSSKQIARTLILWRFAAATRPQSLRRVLRWLRVLR